MNRSEALQCLRAATTNSHRRLDARLDLFGVAFSDERYAQYLSFWWSVLVPFEGRVRDDARVQSLLPDLHERSKLEALEGDLVALSIAPSTLRPARSTLGAQLDDWPSLWGMLYVFEGSMLGAAHLARFVQAKSHIEATRYFRFYGDRLGQRWRTFCAALELALPDQSARTRAALAAVRVFEAIEVELDQQKLLRPLATG